MSLRIAEPSAQLPFESRDGIEVLGSPRVFVRF
jgi:hypothetical protein